MKYILSDKIISLMEKGVRIPNPCSVDIGEDVDIDRISGRGVVLYSGTKLYGNKTLICADTKMGYEAPVTVVDCQLGRNVKLNGGFFKGSVFLDGVEMACGAHVRDGCIIEEEVRAAYTVGLKQTLLFPFVTLGSLVNLCDCLMSGGTDARNHSEVGSSYIHFNYTPNQDKATASLIGDVPTGVMLNQEPIFLGGQGGLVGPVRIGHGTVIAAGTVSKKDCPEGGKLLTGDNGVATERDFHRGLYYDVGRKVRNNICYIANLLALKQWYLHVRPSFFHTHEFGRELCEGAVEKLDMALRERLKRFKSFSENMKASAGTDKGILTGRKEASALAREEELLNNWTRLEECLTKGLEEKTALEKRDMFIDALYNGRAMEMGYVETIQSLDGNTLSIGSAWLQTVVDRIIQETLETVPLCK
ncbi:MAG: UDP-N-acetylglucosamine pyrophosphorylase [Thermodesulfobacteriota bacterium]|nr:UDP-N-acetylglucosamine pyrophosphorylase [Thermodesulfobacteriota bacterium]